MRSKKIRLNQTGILSSIRQLAILEQISIVRYVALQLCIVTMEEIGFKNIANIAWKIYTNEIFQSTTTIVFLAYHLKVQVYDKIHQFSGNIPLIGFISYLDGTLYAQSSCQIFAKNI